MFLAVFSLIFFQVNIKLYCYLSNLNIKSSYEVNYV